MGQSGPDQNGADADMQSKGQFDVDVHMIIPLQVKISRHHEIYSQNWSRMSPKQPFNRPPVQSSLLDGGEIVCHLRRAKQL